MSLDKAIEHGKEKRSQYSIRRKYKPNKRDAESLKHGTIKRELEANDKLKEVS